MYNIQASGRIGLRLSDFFNEWRDHWFVLAGWVETSLMTLLYGRSLFRNNSSVGQMVAKLDYQGYILMAYNLAQVTVNVLFCLRDSMPTVFSPANTTDLYDLSDTYAPGEQITRAHRPFDEGEDLGIYLTLQS